MDNILFSVRNLSKTFHKNVVALNEISFFGKRDSIIGIVGPNGSGKTTLLSIFAGLIRQDHGSIEMEKNLSIGASVGDISYFPHLTALENLNFIARLKGLNKRLAEGELKKLLGLVGLDYNKKANTFSFGMRQRYAIASTMVGAPDIILLDEPTVGIDPIDIEEIKEVIKRSAADRSLIFSSHQLEEVLALSDYVLGLSYGQMLFFENIEAIKEAARERQLNAKQYLLEQMKASQL